MSGLKFGGSSIVGTDGVVLVRNRVHDRYWPTIDVDVTALHQRFINLDFNF